MIYRILFCFYSRNAEIILWSFCFLSSASTLGTSTRHVYHHFSCRVSFVHWILKYHNLSWTSILLSAVTLFHPLELRLVWRVLLRLVL
jgi:hypothetical protein